jgi:hypothetical protein
MAPSNINALAFFMAVRKFSIVFWPQSAEDAGNHLLPKRKRFRAETVIVVS